MNAKHDTIKKHSNRGPHIENFNNWNKLPKINEQMIKLNDQATKVTIAELKIANFVA